MHPAIRDLAQRTFLREFAFMSNRFELSPGECRELADVFLVLREQAIAVQMKSRSKRSAGRPEEEQRWFSNKILKSAKRQAKGSFRFLAEPGPLTVRNLAGKNVEVERGRISKLHLVILYDNDKLRYGQAPYYRSDEVGIIHILNVHDWLHCLYYLYTPREVMKYLGYRESAIERLARDGASEREVFACYILGISPGSFVSQRKTIPRRMRKVELGDIPDFDRIVATFAESIYTGTPPEKYYKMLSDLAELTRTERALFVERWDWSGTQAMRMQRGDYVAPRRFMTSEGCGFMFLPVPAERFRSRLEELSRWCSISKYDLKVHRHVGLAVCPRAGGFFVEWCYDEGPWQPSEQLDRFLEKHSPFRPMRSAAFPEYPSRGADSKEA